MVIFDRPGRTSHNLAAGLDGSGGISPCIMTGRSVGRPTNLMNFDDPPNLPVRFQKTVKRTAGLI